MKASLVRLYCDPKKVRVSWHRSGEHGWTVTIRLRDWRNSHIKGAAKARSHNPERALMRALKQAEQMKMPGVDTGLGWAYEHPQGECS